LEGFAKLDVEPNAPIRIKECKRKACNKYGKDTSLLDFVKNTNLYKSKG